MFKKYQPYILAGLVLGIAYLSFEWAVGAIVHYRDVVSVPDIKGRTISEAFSLLSQVKLGMTKEGDQFDKTVPAGLVVQQNPPAGTRVRQGRVVRLMISQGGETIVVPDLIGQPLRNAQVALQSAGLGVGEIDRRPSLRYAKDTVMITDPPGHASVAKNSLVNLIVCEGAPASDVLLAPDFVGRPLSEAKAWAASHQIPLTVREEADLSRPDGQIQTQAPPADTPIRLGDTLTLVVNTLQPSNAAAGGPRVRYDLPPGANDRDVRIYVIDEKGEREVFRQAQAPGSHVDVPVTVQGRGKARIFVNGILVDEQPLP